MTNYPLWPTAEQKLLLRAALAQDEAALDAITAWHARADLDGTIDNGSFRLLPLVHANLEAMGCQHPAMAMLAGIRRRAWVEAQLRDRFAIEVLGEFASSGIPCVVAKGLALAHACYSNPALRPMSDVDLLVEPVSVKLAILALRRLGFAPLDGSDATTVTGHARHFLRNGQEQIDLHVAPFCDVPPAGARRWLWNGAVPFEIGGVAAQRPNDSDMLLHVIVHGLRANPVPPLRWMADTAMIMRHGSALDWDRIVDSAASMKMSLRLRRALHFLRREMKLPVPAEPIARLGHIRPNIYERLEGAWLASAEGNDWTVRWRWRVAIAGRLISTGQYRLLGGLAAGFLWRRLVPASREA